MDLSYKKISLILFDMDGTLLDSNKNLPNNFNKIARKLLDQQIRIAIASGRQYESLIQLFPEFKDEFIFIAENGAICYYQNQCINYDEIDEKDIKKIINSIKNEKTISIIYCGLKNAYTTSKDSSFLHQAKMYYKKLIEVDSYAEIDDKICKIALFNQNNSKFILTTLGEIPKNLSAVLSSKNWVDVSNKQTNKGSVLKNIQEKYHIPYNQTMAFGDYLNDLEMLENSYYSYAMGNAVDQIKTICRFQTLSNDEEGVVKALINNFDFLKENK